MPIGRRFVCRIACRGLKSSIAEACKRSGSIARASIQSADLHRQISYVKYYNIQLNIKELMKGELTQGDLPGIFLMVEERKELSPARGEDFIFFIEKSQGMYRTIKILRDTMEYVGAVRTCLD